METKLEGGHKKGDGKFLKGKNYFMKINDKNEFIKQMQYQQQQYSPNFEFISTY